MNCSVVEITYDRASYRWQVRQAGRKLPEQTHPSKDQAIILGLHLLEENPFGRLIVFDEHNRPQSEIHVRQYGISSLIETKADFGRETAPQSGSSRSRYQQPRRKSDPASSRLRS